MKAEQCKEIRQEIEETNRGEQAGALTMNHVRQCRQCREFFEQNMKLRQLVAGLSPVDAPADFDFRLRARIASEGLRPRRGFRPGSLSFGIPALTFAGLALMVGLFLLLPGMRSTEEAGPITSVIPVQDNVAGTVEATRAPGPLEGAVKVAEIPTVEQSRKSNAGVRKQIPAFRTVSTEIKDLSAVGAPILKPEDSVSDSRIPLSIPLQTLTVSVDDGSGVSRTISFPTVSFGFQRVLTNARPALNPSVKRIW